MRQIKYVSLAVISVIFLLIFTGCNLFPKEEPLLAPPLMKPAEISYSTVKAYRGDIERKIQSSATFISIDQQYMFFKDRGGRIKDIYVKPGDIVKKGDLIAELYTDNLEDEIEQQKLVLRKTQLSYDRLKESGADKYSLESASIDVKLAQMRLDNLLEELEQSKLYSSLDGTVVYVDSGVGPGVNVGAYQNIIRVADPKNLQLQYTGTNLSSFSLGNEVVVEFEKNTYKGIVVSTPASVPYDGDDSLRDEVRIALEVLPDSAGMGDNANISLTLEKSENTIILPKQAIKIYMGRKYVNVLENGLNNERDVETGVETATEVEIISGVEEGEEIILR